jgi:hypothetical protein
VASAQAQFLEKQQTATQDKCILDWARGLLDIRVARMIPECRREAFETEVRRSFSQARPTETYVQSVEKAGREQPRLARGLARRPKAPADGSDDIAGIHE